MKESAYIPKSGDIVRMKPSTVDVSGKPVPEFAFVVTNQRYNRKSGQAMLCAVSAHVDGRAYEVALPRDVVTEVEAASGTARPGAHVVVLAVNPLIEVRLGAGDMRFVARVPRELQNEVLETLLRFGKESKGW